MPTDFEEQVPAQKPQGSSKDEQAREHTNGHDQADADTAGAVTDVVEISIFEKPGADGPLTKVGQLGPDGKPEMDPSYCWMSSGTVRVASFTTMTAGAALIGGLSPQQAIGIGVPKATVPTGGVLNIVAKKLLNGGANVIARTKEHFTFGSKAALMVFDVDTKWLTPEVAASVSDGDKYWSELVGLAPGLLGAARIQRASSSAGLSANGTAFPSSANQHIYVGVMDGTDIPRATRVMHDRAVLAGLGRVVLGDVGQKLVRSIVDVAVASEERLVFEGGPVLKPPLVQDPDVRKPVAYDGKIVDTKKAIPSLSRQERVRLDIMIAAQKTALAPEAARLRGAADQKVAEHLVKTTGVAIEEALHQVALRHVRLLPPELELEFDDGALGVVAVKDVMAQPGKYVDETLADPLEGISYGRCKAKVMWGDSGQLIVHSFAHGGAVYRLVHNEATLRALIAATGSDAVASAVIGNFEPDALPLDAQERLLKATAKKAKVNIKTVRQMLKDAMAHRRAKERAEKQSARKAFDERARMDCPASDAPVQDVAMRIDTVLAAVVPSSPDKLPMRGLDGRLAAIRTQSLPEEYFHELHDADDDVDDSDHGTQAKKPAPPGLTLTTVEHNNEIAMLVENHIRIEREDKDGTWREVSLPFAHRDPLNHLDKSQMPVAVGIATVPMVRVDPRRGTCELIEAEGLHHKTGVFFDIPADIRAALPRPEDCDERAVAKAVRFLCDDWLVDVQTNEAGKATAIAKALTILQRHRLKERPAFMVNAAQAGSGKTTLVNMVAMAATGGRAAASAWSKDAEERRKALFSFFLSGVSLLCFDNIPRGMDLHCPHVEKALTSGEISDRMLGTNVTRTASTAGVLAWTGNAISARADLATRVLAIDITAASSNPANRTVRHGEPVEWTRKNRARILAALFTILMAPRPCVKVSDRKTRFKRWWWEVGLAVERAFGGRIDFAAMFDASIGRDIEGAALAEFLGALVEEYGTREFSAADVAWMLDRHPPVVRNDAGVAVNSFDAADSGSKHVNRADAMRGWLTAVLGRGPLQGAITGVDAGNIMRSFVGRVVDMAEQGEACLTNRRDRATNASMWRIEWKRRTARWQIGNVLLFGSDEERQAVREAIEACGVDILSLDAATEGELTAALESLKK